MTGQSWRYIVDNGTKPTGFIEEILFWTTHQTGTGMSTLF